MLECTLVFRHELVRLLAKEGGELQSWMDPLRSDNIIFMSDIAIRPSDEIGKDTFRGMKTLSLNEGSTLIQCSVSGMHTIVMGGRRIEPSPDNIYYCKSIMESNNPNYAIYAVFVLPAKSRNFNQSAEGTLEEILPYNAMMLESVKSIPDAMLAMLMKLGKGVDCRLKWFY